MAEQMPPGAPLTPPKPKPKPAPKRKPLWPWFVGGAVILGFITLVLLRLYKPSAVVETTDARVAGHYATVAPRIAGQVIQVPVDDNQAVRAGQLLLELDPRDQEAAVANAEANLQRDRARINTAAANLSRQPALIGQAAAAVPSAQARITLAEQNLRRYANLAQTGAGTVQNRQQAEAALKEAQADLQGAQAGLLAARQQTMFLQSEQAAARAQVRSDEAMLGQARLNLSYTRVAAALDGTVGQKTVQVGDYIAAGSPVMSVVPLEHVYIDANYREIALTHVLPGQHVRIHVDAYNIDLHGHVDSLAPATGATFSAIPPENATGNFTKIVQRLTVKILVDPGQPLAGLLRVGLNVETFIDTGLAPVVSEQTRRGTAAPPVTAR